jgi:hypothetical protein
MELKTDLEVVPDRAFSAERASGSRPSHLKALQLAAIPSASLVLTCQGIAILAEDAVNY